MAVQLRDNLWQLDIPLVGNPLKNLNSYLITGERNLLIDTGFRQEPCRVAMEEQLGLIGIDRDKTDIFITHLHNDHSGLAPDLIRPGCRIYIGRIDGEVLIENRKPSHWRDFYDIFIHEGFAKEDAEQLWLSNPAQNLIPGEYSDYVFMDEGDELTYGGQTFRCILTPGHTPGHICLYDEENQWLFSGDHVLFHITPNITRWMTMDDSLGSYLESLDKIRDLPVRLLMPAHRKETGELKERIDFLKDHHMRRLENVLSILREEPGISACRIASRMKWSIRAKDWSDFPVNQKFFAVGEAMSHLDYLRIRGKVIREFRDGTYIYFPV